MDPFERAPHNSNSYYEWMEERAQFIAVGAQAYAAQMISTFADFPPRQKPASFNLEQIMSSFMEAGSGK